MRTGAGREISSARKQLHGTVVYFAVTALGAGHRPARFCKGGRVEYYHIVFRVLFAQLGQQLENVGAFYVETVGKPVSFGVFLYRLAGKFRNIHRRHALCAAFERVQCKRTGVREAVEYRHPAAYPCDGKPIVFLVEEKSGFLPVFNVHIVKNPVFGYTCHRVCGGAVPALVLRYAFKNAQRGFVSFVYPAYAGYK